MLNHNAFRVEMLPKMAQGSHEVYGHSYKDLQVLRVARWRAGCWLWGQCSTHAVGDHAGRAPIIVGSLTVQPDGPRERLFSPGGSCSLCPSVPWQTD